MPVPNFGGLPPYPTFGDVTDKVNKLVNELRNLLLNLDTLNISQLNAEVIEAGTITGDKIKAGTITADKIEVNELSAISANLGHITAGLIEAVTIFGSYIATANGTYPRCEMSSVGNLFGAYTAADNAVVIDPFYQNDRPAIKFNNGQFDFSTIDNSNGLNVQSGTSMFIQSGSGPITIATSSPEGIRFQSWGTLVNIDTGNNLQDDLDEKADVVDAGYNIEFDSITRNLKMYNKDGDQIAITNIP